MLTAVTTPVTSSTKSRCPVARLVDVDGRLLALSTLAAPRFTAVTTCEALTVNAFPRLKSIASPVCWFVDNVSGNGAELITGAAAAPPEIVLTLPATQPVLPSVWVQKVTTGFERLMVMLVYEPAGIVADMPRKAESLCNLVRSTLKLVLFSGIFILVPVDEVSVMVFTSTMKDRRLVLGGGVSGAAFHVMLSVAVPPPQLTVQGGFGTPLHETKATPDNKTSAAKTFRKFMQPPRQSECRA